MKTTKTEQQCKDELDKMTQTELCHLLRFAPIGHEVFCNDRLHDHFLKQYTELGGMTPEISKTIGWEN